jgi:hypothetical protein
MSPSSLAPGVGGKAPGMEGAVYEGCASCFHPDTGLPPFPGCDRSDVFGRVGSLNSEASGLVGLSSFVGLGAKVSPRAVRWRGLDLPDGELPAGVTAALAAFFKRSSVARRRASKASSSEVWDETALFFSDTAASRSARLLSILKRSFNAREKDRAMVDWGLSFCGFHSWSSSSSDMLRSCRDKYVGKVESCSR